MGWLWDALWCFNIAMEESESHDLFVDDKSEDLPMNVMVIFHSYVLSDQVG